MHAEVSIQNTADLIRTGVATGRLALAPRISCLLTLSGLQGRAPSCVSSSVGQPETVFWRRTTLHIMCKAVVHENWRSNLPVLRRASLQRLGIQKAGLYMQHWPGFVTNGWANDAFVAGLGDCALQGLTQAVGVSNFTADRVRKASSILEVRCRPLEAQCLLSVAPSAERALPECTQAMCRKLPWPYSGSWLITLLQHVPWILLLRCNRAGSGTLHVSPDYWQECAAGIGGCRAQVAK